MITELTATTPISYTPPTNGPDERTRIQRAVVEVKEAKPKDPVPAAKDPAVPDTNMKEIVKELNDAVGALNSRLSFYLDSETKKVVVKIVDSETGETVRQIPPEDALKLSQRMNEIVGVLLDKSE
jgi:flagellar protein FlaG